MLKMFFNSNIQFKDTKSFGILELRQQGKNTPFKGVSVKYVKKICKII